MSKIRVLSLILILIFTLFGGEFLYATTGTNPYTSSLSVNNRNVLNTWIRTKITIRKNTTTYPSFVRSVITKINNLKSNTTSSKQIVAFNYLVYELNTILNQTEDESLFLDEIDVPDPMTNPSVPIDPIIPPSVPTLTLDGAIRNVKTVTVTDSLRFSWYTPKTSSYVIKIEVPASNIKNELAFSGTTWNGSMNDIGLSSGTVIFSVKGCSLSRVCSIYSSPVTVNVITPNINNTTVNSLAGSIEYIPFVHNGSTDFKTKFEPGVGSLYISEFQGTNKDETYIVNHRSNNALFKYKVFVPPGTRRISLTLGTYVSDTEGKVVAAFGHLPTLTFDQINNTEASKVDSSRVLELLYSGKEVQFYSPPRAGFIIMSQPNFLINSGQTALGSWVYFNALSIPGDKILDQYAAVDVDQRCYRSWYKKAIRENLFDSSGNPIETKNGMPYRHTVENEDLAYCRGM